MREPDYRGLAALVLATALGLMLVIGVGAPSLSGQPLGEVGSQALTAIGGAIVGLLAGFIAGTISRNGNNDKDKKP
jgi:hypothetical protein